MLEISPSQRTNLYPSRTGGSGIFGVSPYFITCSERTVPSCPRNTTLNSFLANKAVYAAAVHFPLPGFCGTYVSFSEINSPCTSYHPLKSYSSDGVAVLPFGAPEVWLKSSSALLTLQLPLPSSVFTEYVIAIWESSTHFALSVITAPSVSARFRISAQSG